MCPALERPHVAQHLGLLVANRLGVRRRRRLHRQVADDLQQVVLDDVANDAGLVVELAAALDAEALGHRDLHVLDVVPIPDRLEERVGEAEIEDVLHRLFARGSDRCGRCDSSGKAPWSIAVELARRLRDRGRTASRRSPARSSVQRRLGELLDRRSETCSAESPGSAPDAAPRRARACSCANVAGVAVVAVDVAQPRHQRRERRLVERRRTR